MLFISVFVRLSEKIDEFAVICWEFSVFEFNASHIHTNKYFKGPELIKCCFNRIFGFNGF